MTDLNDQDIETPHESEQLGSNMWVDELHPSKPSLGWYQKSSQSSFVYVERDKSTLVVSFDNLQDAGSRGIDRLPWGYKFFAKFGYSHLGIMVNKANWFRDQDIIDKLSQLQKDGFFEQFDNVAFTGTSMGGFAALAFSRLVPGCNVIAFSPQTTLDQRLVPWEDRFGIGQAQNWDLEFSDASVGLEAANQVYIVYDPLFSPDRKQVERIPDLPNVQHLKLPGCGHKTAVVLKRLNALALVQQGGIMGEIDPIEFRTLARGRRYLIIYRHEMGDRIFSRLGEEAQTKWNQAFKARKRKYIRQNPPLG